MTGFRAAIAIGDGLLTLTLTEASAVQEVTFDCVIDQTDFGDVVGIEVLDLGRRRAGGFARASPSSGFPWWSYDDEIDAFYMRVAEGRAQTQRPGSGIAQTLWCAGLPRTHVHPAGGGPGCLAEGLFEPTSMIGYGSGSEEAEVTVVVSTHG